MASPQQAVQRGIVKQVLSGDSIVVRGQPRGGPPPERTIGLSNVTAPRLARRPNPALENTETKDEPFAWEAREFLRKKLIGREVSFTVEYKVPGTGKEYCYIYNGKDTESENMAESIIGEGLVDLRHGGLKPNDEGQQNLVQLEETTKAAGKGKWVSEEEQAKHIREVKWNIENLRHFVDSHHGKPIDAVIEHVRDGCTVRAFLLPSFHYVTVMLSGIKCPMFKLEADKQTPEPFAEEAKFFTESRLLNRDVQIILEGVSNQNILGSVLHPKGNIAELLLKEGFARCVDWSMGVVSQGIDKLRSAEKVAKEKRARIWKDYAPSASTIDVKDKNYSGKVVEVVNGDALVLKMADGSSKKIFLSSIRSPRPVADEEPKKKDPRYRPRPLYDTPFMFEAREFLRKKLIGKKVNISVDYIQPKSDDFPEKTCCTVTINNINVAEALVGRGLASVVRYRQDDDKRSAHYDELLAAEARANKKGAGIHSKKDTPQIRVADVSGDVNKAKQFLPFLQRAGRSEAIVEFVASGSRLRLYIPRETCLVTFLLSGLSCPRGPRPTPDRSGNMIPGDEYGEEAQQFTKEMVLQKEVEVEVESMDKGGNFIGWLFIDNNNLSVSLVEEGLSKVHFTAERSSCYGRLCQAEEKAKSEKRNMWSKFEEPTETLPENEPQERKVDFKTVCITEITDELHFYAQNVDTGPQLEKLMEQLREELGASPPLPGSYLPRKGELCAAKFSDGEWYRAKVLKVTVSNVELFYIDYGNKELSDPSKLATLPATYQTLPAHAKEYAVACVALPKDEDDIHTAVDTLFHEILNKECLLNTEYRVGNLEYVSLLFSDSKEDVAQSLIAEGMLLVEPRKEKRLAKIVGNYMKAQEKAKNARLCLWRYGDFTEDDAKEFGYRR